MWIAHWAGARAMLATAVLPALALALADCRFDHTGLTSTPGVDAPRLDVATAKPDRSATSRGEPVSDGCCADRPTRAPDLVDPKLDLPGPELDLPGPKPDLPGPKLDLPGPKPDLPASQPDLPGPKPDLPGPKPDLPASQPDLPGPKPDLPGPEPDLPKPKPDLVPKKTCDQLYGAAKDYFRCREDATSCDFFTTTDMSSCATLCKRLANGACIDAVNTNSADRCGSVGTSACDQGMIDQRCICSRP